MTDTLFFRFANDAIEWLRFDARGQMQDCRLDGADEFKAATRDFAGRRVLVVPGESVLLTSAAVPSRQQRQIAQAVPYVVEEHLAADIESCFFALGDRNARGEIRVAVLEAALLPDWIARLEAMDLLVTTIVSESDLVAHADGMVAVRDGDRVHVGLGDGRGITARFSDLPLLVSLVPGSSALRLEADAAESERQVSEIEAAGHTVELVSPRDASFVSLCLGYNGRQINLRQGPYRIEEHRTRTMAVWRSVALLAGLAVSLHLLLQFGQGWYLSGKAEQMRANTLDLYAEIFPADRNVRDIRRRWDAHLGKSGNTSNEFISLFARAAKGLPAAELTLNNVNFNESRGDLVLQVSGSRSESLVQYTQKLTSEGISAEIGTISQDDGNVKGSIKVKVPGGAS